MLLNCAQKTQLLSYIEDHIAMLELRINLNNQSIIPVESIRMEAAYQNVGAFQLIETTLLKNEEADSVIHECKLAINKLSILKKFLPLIEAEYLLTVFTNYDRWDMKEILNRLKYSMNN